MQASLGVSRSQAADVLSVHLLEELPAAAELPSEVLREVMDSKDAKRYCSEDITSATNIGGETPGERKSFQKLLKQKVLTISQESAKAQNIHKPKANSDGNAAKKFITDSDKGYWHAAATDESVDANYIKSLCPQGEGYTTLVSKGSTQGRWLATLCMHGQVIERSSRSFLLYNGQLEAGKELARSLWRIIQHRSAISCADHLTCPVPNLFSKP